MQKSHGFFCNTRSNLQRERIKRTIQHMIHFHDTSQIRNGWGRNVTKDIFNRQIIFTQIIYRHLVYQRKRSGILRDYLVHTFYICNVTISHRLQSFCMKTSIVWTSLWKLTIASVRTSGESDYVPLYSCHPFDWLSS